jgi:phage-related protein
MIQSILAALPADVAADFLQRLDQVDLTDTEQAAMHSVQAIVQEMIEELDESDLSRLIQFALSLAPEAVVQTVFANRT